MVHLMRATAVLMHFTGRCGFDGFYALSVPMSWENLRQYIGSR
jgi:hypothetical protein